MGYRKVPLTGIANGGLTLISSPFTVVLGGDFRIQDLFVDNSAFIGGEAEQESDVIKIWTGLTYLTYFYSSDADYAWVSDSNPFVETDEKIPSGIGAWFMRSGSEVTSTMIAGEVITTNCAITAKGGSNALSLLGNPFGEALPLSNISAVGLNAGEAEQEADVIKVWTGKTYLTYFYSSDAGDAWVSDDNPFVATNEKIPANNGFWFIRHHGSEVNLTFKVPYNVD